MDKSPLFSSHPLLQAVIDNDIASVEELSQSSWKHIPDPNGFSPLEIAQFLGHRECQLILNGAFPPPGIKVQTKDQTKLKKISLKDFKTLFQADYRSFLTFSSYSDISAMIRRCPYFLRFKWLAKKNHEIYTQYANQIQNGVLAQISIRWIDERLGYGAFLEEDLPANAFVGEYTGKIRLYDKDHPDPAGFCFAYPTAWTTWDYYAVDATHEGNITRFFNHSLEPNLQPTYVVDRGILHLVFFTKKALSKNTQLTFNYGKNYWRERVMIPN